MVARDALRQRLARLTAHDFRSIEDVIKEDWLRETFQLAVHANEIDALSTLWPPDPAVPVGERAAPIGWLDGDPLVHSRARALDRQPDDVQRQLVRAIETLAGCALVAHALANATAARPDARALTATLCDLVGHWPSPRIDRPPIVLAEDARALANERGADADLADAAGWLSTWASSVIEADDRAPSSGNDPRLLRESVATVRDLTLGCLPNGGVRRAEHTAKMGVLLDAGNDGVAAILTLESRPGGIGAIYPDESRALALAHDAEFDRAIEVAWALEGAPARDRRLDVRWQITRDANERITLPPICGGSLGSAFAVALRHLLDPKLPSLDPRNALTGTIDAHGRIGSVEGYAGKLKAARRRFRPRVIVPDADIADEAIRAHRYHGLVITPVASIDEASREASSKTLHPLTVVNFSNHAVDQHFDAIERETGCQIVDYKDIEVHLRNREPYVDQVINLVREAALDHRKWEDEVVIFLPGSQWAAAILVAYLAGLSGPSIRVVRARKRDTDDPPPHDINDRRSEWLFQEIFNFGDIRERGTNDKKESAR